MQSLQWRHNGRDGVSNHRRDDCLLNRFFGCRSNKTLKLRVTGLCAENSPVTGEFAAQGSVTRKMFPFDDVIVWNGLFHIVQITKQHKYMVYLYNHSIGLMRGTRVTFRYWSPFSAVQVTNELLWFQELPIVNFYVCHEYDMLHVYIQATMRLLACSANGKFDMTKI